MAQPRLRHTSKRTRRGRRSISRTIPLPGDGNDDGNWYKCWSCGMHCNDITDEIDSGASRMQTTYSDFALDNLGPQPGVARTLGGSQLGSVSPVMGGMNNVFIAVRQGMDGSPLPVVHYFEIIDTKGCPNDGNLNWRGDY